MVSVKVVLPPEATEVGLNDADTPAGIPLALKVTVCGLPLTTAELIVAVAP